MTLANDEITMRTDVAAGAIGSTSLAIGAGGSIMCFGNITAAFGGIMYANSGLECSSMLCQGNSNINTLTVQQDTTLNNLTLVGKLIHGWGRCTEFRRQRQHEFEQTGTISKWIHGNCNMWLHGKFCIQCGRNE